MVYYFIVYINFTILTFILLFTLIKNLLLISELDDNISWLMIRYIIEFYIMRS